ncbi:hypothetical protein VTH06DRAFT_3976 [Thermothelomyces fergusii]
MLQNLEAEVSSLRTSSPENVLSIYNPNPTTFSGVPDLATAVEQTAVDFPDKDAVCFADCISADVVTTTTISFAELNETANRIAWYLEQHGVREGQVVAIVMEKSIRLYAGILAILKTGCAYLPLLPSTPMTRIEAIFQQGNVKTSLVDTATHGLLKGRLPCILIDVQCLNLRQTPPALSARPPPDPKRLAYVIYTSGSTGVPKGVCVTQLSIMSNLDALSRIYPVKEDSRLLQSCSQAFDVSVFEIFFAWTQGMCLCSGTNDTLFEDLERSIRKLKVTHLSMTPTVASLVDPDKVPLVELLVAAEVVPYGCLGELCFGGDQVAAGYLGMPQLTAEKFINHPAYGRLYRSGDLGRMLPDGSMVIVGRADDLIKIRGQRVELEEITEAIRQTGAADCATLLLAAEETGNRGQIVSFLVPAALEKSGFEVLGVDGAIRRDILFLHHALESRLPAYMLPSAIIPISKLPVTSSGKLDRKRLEQAYRNFGKERLALVTHGPSTAEADGKWSSMEIEVADVVSGALNVDRSDVQRVHGDPEKLKRAWSNMIARHDILRTCFVETDSTEWPILQLPNAIESLEPALSLATIVQADRIYLSLVCHHALAWVNSLAS